MDRTKDINLIRYHFKEPRCISEKIYKEYFSIEVPYSLEDRKVKQKLDKLVTEETIGYVESCLAEGQRI